MADATALTPPSPGLSATLLSSVKPYSPKGPENVNITTLYRCTRRRGHHRGAIACGGNQSQDITSAHLGWRTSRDTRLS